MPPVGPELEPHQIAAELGGLQGRTVLDLFPSAPELAERHVQTVTGGRGTALAAPHRLFGLVAAKRLYPFTAPPCER